MAKMEHELKYFSINVNRFSEEEHRVASNDSNLVGRPL